MDGVERPQFFGQVTDESEINQYKLLFEQLQLNEHTYKSGVDRTTSPPNDNKESIVRVVGFKFSKLDSDGNIYESVGDVSPSKAN